MARPSSERCQHGRVPKEQPGRGSLHRGVAVMRRPCCSARAIITKGLALLTLLASVRFRAKVAIAFHYPQARGDLVLGKPVVTKPRVALVISPYDLAIL